MSELKEPWISIEGVLWDVQANKLSIEEGMKEIRGYFVEADTKP